MSVIHRSFPGSPPPLRPGEVHVWFARLDPCPARAAGHLSEDERTRAAGYKLPRVRDQFVAARGVLREILGRYLRLPPRELTIGLNADGKPVLTSPHSGALHFNVSHSAGVGLIAVSTQPVGVDLEAVRVVESANGLVDRFFAAEERAAYSELPESAKPAGFLHGWTCKEAVLKAVGMGMRRMEGCAVEMDPVKPPRVHRLDGSDRTSWTIETWTPCDGFVAAVAYQ